MKQWKSILLLLLVFFAGLAVGVVGTRAIVRRAVQQAVIHPEKAQLLMERNLTRRLQLDHEQQAQLHAILTATRGQLGAVRKEFQPRTMAVLREEYLASGRAGLFGHLENCLARDESTLSYAEIAARLNLTEAAVKMAVQRLRGRYREILRHEIAETVSTESEVEEELRHLFSAFGS